MARLSNAMPPPDATGRKSDAARGLGDCSLPNDDADAAPESRRPEAYDGCNAERDEPPGPGAADTGKAPGHVVSSADVLLQSDSMSAGLGSGSGG